MRESTSLLPLAASGIAAFTLVAAVFLSSDFVVAGDADTATRPRDGASRCECPGASDRPQRPKFAELKPGNDGRPLDAGDEIAALSSVQHALASVADGATYVWHRRNGRLSGLVKPTTSFRNSQGAVCRHVIVLLTTGPVTRKTEGVACREANGTWALEG